ncbi:hypothetical protein [Zwartia vadi]|uniref:hypothetical protein n=1 Tax=Zwartia vadi TaxID=3058168 RepID=UPI0025B4CAED|nr:hypothetical protein [Zwartia vadi]MDN3988807.1 hypothetical protein [Zwartia vadi]
MKKFSIALTVAALSSAAFAQNVGGVGGNGGAIVEDPARGGIAPDIRSGAYAGTGGKGSAGGNGGAGSPFDEWDLDRNGFLSTAEANQAGFTEAQFIAMDTDRDGRVTLKEFTVASIMPIRSR